MFDSHGIPKDFFKKADFEKISSQQSHQNFFLEVEHVKQC